MPEYINWNGKIVDKNSFHVSPDSRALKYGDGFFETIKVNKLSICLQKLHIERMFESLQLLQFDIPASYTPAYFQQQIQSLLYKNNHTSLSRVRVMFYRGNGGLYDQENNFPNFVVQSLPLQEVVNQLNVEGLKIDVFKDARKSCDRFSMIKSNNCLSYIMAAFHVAKQGLNDTIILNHYGRIAESSIANVFIVQEGIIKTPPLIEGCINGVYRRFLINSFCADKIKCIEEPITVDDLLQASEVFLTNAITGIRWVYNCGTSYYKKDLAVHLHNKYSTIE